MLSSAPPLVSVSLEGKNNVRVRVEIRRKDVLEAFGDAADI